MMAEVLSDNELRNIIGTVIKDGAPNSIRPNSYVLRLGESGEFLNSGKAFKLGKGKKGIRVAPGHSVGVISRETIDFSREAVREHFPDHDLHGIISPTTDLAREGIVAPTTQVDAGYKGTLNWTIVNTSSHERRFVFEERCFRLTIFKLADGERPDQVYDGDYQGHTGYVPSQRRGAPVGIKEHEWEDSTTKGGPEDLLQGLIKSGYPWNVLGERLAALDGQFKTVTNEYAEIAESIHKLQSEVSSLRSGQDNLTDRVRKAVSDQIPAAFAPIAFGASTVLIALIGLGLAVLSSERAVLFLDSYGGGVGLLIMLGAGIVGYIYRRKPRDS